MTHTPGPHLTVRYIGYDTHTGENHYAVSGSIKRDLPPIPLGELMQASPALLEALEALVALDEIRVIIPERFMRPARTAIALAKGETLIST